MDDVNNALEQLMLASLLLRITDDIVRPDKATSNWIGCYMVTIIDFATGESPVWNEIFYLALEEGHFAELKALEIAPKKLARKGVHLSPYLGDYVRSKQGPLQTPCDPDRRTRVCRAARYGHCEASARP